MNNNYILKYFIIYTNKIIFKFNLKKNLRKIRWQHFFIFIIFFLMNVK